jgi:hAT family C-terminal dimerisation region
MKLFCITTDSASNNGKMMKELSKLLRKRDGIKWNGPAHHIRCLAHVINLAVKAFLGNLKIAKLSEEHEWITCEDPEESDIDEESGGSDDEDLYGDDPNNQDDLDEYTDDAASFNIDDTKDFKTVLLKVRTICNAATVTQKCILSFLTFCQATNLTPLRPIRDHAIRWSATFNMLRRALYLRRAIDMWTQSQPIFERLQMSSHEWDMVEFLVQFLYPFMAANTTVQATARPSLSDTWVVYEQLFDTLDDAKNALNGLQVLPEWLKETQTAIEKMWAKLRKYYDKTGKPFAYIDATLLHPDLKKKFMRKAGYSANLIENYVKQAETRFQNEYDSTQCAPRNRRPTQRGKRRRPSTSDSDSSDGMEYNEFSSYMQIKRDPTITNELEWWKGSHSMYPKLSKMACDVMAVPATGAGVEREFSISGRVVTKQRNRLSPTTIQDIMQYKHWVVRHGIVIPEEESQGIFSEMEDDEMANEEDEVFEDEDEEEGGLSEWLKEWDKRERVSEKVKRIAMK